MAADKSFKGDKTIESSTKEILVIGEVGEVSDQLTTLNEDDSLAGKKKFSLNAVKNKQYWDIQKNILKQK